MLEDIVVSLETAKKLKAAGWNKPTVHYWVKVANMWAIATRAENSFFCIMPNGDMRVWDITALQEFYPAPTAEEISQELPSAVQEKYSGWFDLGVKRCRNGEYMPWCALMRGHGITYKKMSEAAAQMWLWCKEKGYL